MLEQVTRSGADDAPGSSAGDPAGRRRVLTAAALGSLLALIPDVLMLLGRPISLFRGVGLLGSMYDAQARSFLHGHLAVDPSKLGFEGYAIGGHTYSYYGPVPSLFRLPVLLITHQLDGRLTQLSMLIALIVLLVAGASLQWTVRTLVRPGAPVGRVDLWSAGLGAFALGAGSVVLYLLSRPVVYNETELWGAALAIAALDALLRTMRRPSRWRIAWLAVLATLTINTRVSVGLGPIFATLLVVLWARWPRRPPRWPNRTVVALAAAAIIPLAISAAVNEAKFRTPFGVPLAAQTDVAIDPIRRAALAANHGSLFGPQFVPTTLLAAVRPDAVGTERGFPFLGLPQRTPTVVGNVVFDDLEPSLSATTSMPLFLLLTIVALIGSLRRPERRPLFAVLVGTAGVAVATLTLAYTNTRYLADFLPFLWLGACIGLQTLLGRPRPARRRATRPLLTAGAAVLVLIALVINGAASLETQRLINPETSPATRAAFVSTQNDVDHLLDRRPGGVATGPALPARAGRLGDLFVVGRCAGLYVASFGGGWLPVERTNLLGYLQLTAPVAARTLASVGAGTQQLTLSAAQAKTLRLSVAGRLVGAATWTPAASPAPVTLSIDPFLGRSYATVTAGDHTLFTVPVPYTAGERTRVGAGVRLRSGRAPVCQTLARRAGVLP